MAATTTEGTGNGSVENVRPKIFNGVVRTENIDPSTVISADVADSAVTTAKINNSAVTTAKINDSAVTTAKINDSAVTTAKINDSAVTVAKMKVFKSAEQTGSGVNQNIAHGLGVVPALVMVYPTDTSVTTEGVYVVSEGTHTTTNVVVAVTSGKKYVVVAFA